MPKYNTDVSLECSSVKMKGDNTSYRVHPWDVVSRKDERPLMDDG